MTDTDLETRIRQVVSADAERAPQTMVTLQTFLARAGAVDEPIRRHPMRYRWAAVAAAALVGAGTGALVITNRGGGSAFASWVSRPQSISGGQADSVRRVCAGAVSPSTSKGAIVVGGAQPANLGRVVVIDRRGSTAYVVLTNGTTWTDCVATIPGLTPDKGLPNSYRHYGPIADVENSATGPNQPMVVLSAKTPEGNNVLGHPITWVSGRVSAAVARVDVATSSGTVVATMRDGVFAAWWPGNDGATAAVRAYDKNGHLLSTITGLNCAKRTLVDPRIQVTGQRPTGGCS